MWDIIVCLTPDNRKQFLYLSGNQITYAYDVRNASCFKHNGEAVSRVLNRARVEDKNSKFYVISCPSDIFNAGAENIIEEEQILNDTYLYPINY
jgi:hypothetical protein